MRFIQKRTRTGVFFLAAAVIIAKTGAPPAFARTKRPFVPETAQVAQDCGPYGHKGPWGGCIPGGPLGAGNYYVFGPPYYPPKPFLGPPFYGAAPDGPTPEYGPLFWGSSQYGIPFFQ